MTPFAPQCIRPAAGAVLLTALLAACAGLGPSTAGIGAPVAWSALPGWETERPAEAWPALLAGCQKIAARDPRWRDICADAALFPEPDDAIARAFFETRFLPHAIAAEGLITGYYEPLLHGSRTASARYRYPIYRPPDDLLMVDMGELVPELAGRRLRGRVSGKRVVPYFSRAEIENGKHALAGQELLWVDDPVALFLLHIQGSGRVRLPDGTTLPVGYADQNGHPYVAIGRILVERGILKLEEVDLPAIRAWLAANPHAAPALLNGNPSYVFFTLRDPALPGPLGALQVPLLPERALAVDPNYIPLGVPVWLDTSLPGETSPYRRLVFAFDTGGAIKGPARADVFFGHGPRAEDYAGRMKQPGRLYVLLPRPRP